MKDVAVSIVTHGAPVEEVERVVGCLLRCRRARTVDIIDNSERENALAYEKRIKPMSHRVRIRHTQNRGYGAGHNIALRESIENDLTYHLVINSDIVWEGDVVGELCNVLDERPEVALIMPKIFYPDGALQLTSRRLPTPFDVFAKRFLPRRLIGKRLKKYLLQEADHDREIDSPYLLGSFMLMRVSSLKRTGIFDERFFMYPEDIDLTRRLHRHYTTLFYPSLSIIHEHRAASRRSVKMLRIHIVNMIRYFNKWGWWIDPERRRMNRTLDTEIKKLPAGKIPRSRG